MDWVGFNRVERVGTEPLYIEQAIASAHLTANGQFTQRCRQWLEERIGVHAALLVHSATAALEMSAMLVDIGPGDEVIMPSFTFVSTANAFALRGGVPVFVDVREDTLNLDERLVEDAITPRTRAIVPVHYAGVGAEMTAINEIAGRYGIPVIEDAAQGIMASYRGRPLGGLSQLAALSFHETKNVTCGEGGALLVNDPQLLERADILREKGTDRSKFTRGQVDKYSWVDLGSSYALSDLNAAFLWAQLEAADELTRRRLEVWRQYHDAFAGLEDRGLVRRPIIPEHCRHNAHMYYLLCRSADERTRLLGELNARGVNAVFHYVPLHSAPAGRRLSRAHGQLPVTERLSARLLRLPMWPGLSESQIDQVTSTVIELAEP